MTNKPLLWVGLAIQIIVNGGIVFVGLASMDWSFITKELIFIIAFIGLNLFSLISLLIGALSD